MLKRGWAILFAFLPAFFACVSAWADSTLVYREKLTAAALGEFHGGAAVVQYINRPGRVQPSVDAAVADTSLAARYGSALLGAVTFTVNYTTDQSDLAPGNGVCDFSILPGNQCTFRAAIEEANVTAGLDIINFNIGTALKTITPTSALPTIADFVIIDGTTNPGFAGTPIISLNGTSAGALADGLHITSGGCLVRGLVINRFSLYGIELVTGGSNVIEGNFIGTDSTGTVGLGNSLDGVFIDDSPNNTIGGTTTGARNVISGNGEYGVAIERLASTGNIVQGNFIGTDLTGMMDLGNSLIGVVIGGSPNNTVGGTTAAARNIISGNNRSGVFIDNATGNQVSGNFIGTDVTGTLDLGNGIGVGIDAYGNQNNTIGGTTAGARNVISGNGSGVQIGNFNYVTLGGTQVLGNFIGTDVTGTVRLGNSFGVKIINSWFNTIGGTTAAARNVISGNTLDGVLVFGSNMSGSAAGNQVLGNYIGTDATGAVNLGNSGNGVRIDASPPSFTFTSTIGGTAPGAGNVIAYNGINGVRINPVIFPPPYNDHNSILSNSLFANTALGIDLDSVGVTPNDSGDGDGGTNNLQNFPVLTSASSVGSNTTIKGTFNSTANDSFRIEFFSNDSCDTSGYGEGQTFIGSTNLMTDGSGNVSINVTFPVAVPDGKFITATATDSAGNTSEFCQCETLVACAAAKGDMNASGNLSPADVVLMLNCVFLAQGNCDFCFADVNCSGGLSPADAVIELNMVFLGAAPPC